jgi:hypothetical protein
VVKYTKKTSILKKLLFGKKDKEIPSFGYVEYQNIGQSLFEILKMETNTKIIHIAEKIYNLIKTNILHGNLSIKNIIFHNGNIYLINPISRSHYHPNLHILQILYSLYKYQKEIHPTNFLYLTDYFTNLFAKLSNILTYNNMLECYGKITMKTYIKILLKNL